MILFLFLFRRLLLVLSFVIVSGVVFSADPTPSPATEPSGLMGHRFLTFNTIVRVRQIEVTRYDLPAKEPADPESGQQSRNWSLINRINQKGSRPQDQPVALTELTAEEQTLIRRRYPELFASDIKAE